MRATHIAGVDSLRFICATWVLLDHSGGLPVDAFTHMIHAPMAMQAFLHRLNGVAFNGTAAVMVFFVISGFCIHWPNRGHSNVTPLPFYIRRMVRLGIPLIGAVVLARWISGRPDELSPVLWSLYCELIYYAIYPALVRLAAQFGWKRLFWISLAGAIVPAIVTDSNGGFFWADGIAITWILGLPLWIAGVLIAERKILWEAPVPKRILIGTRVLAWSYSAAAVALQFHSPIHYKITMLLFCPLAVAWFVAEVRNANAKGPSPLLEAGGKASYSVYLCHLIALNFLTAVDIRTNDFEMFTMKIGFAFVLSATFYYLIEQPGHILARAASRRARTILAARSTG